MKGSFGATPLNAGPPRPAHAAGRAHGCIGVSAPLSPRSRAAPLPPPLPHTHAHAGKWEGTNAGDRGIPPASLRYLLPKSPRVGRLTPPSGCQHAAVQIPNAPLASNRDLQTLLRAMGSSMRAVEPREPRSAGIATGVGPGAASRPASGCVEMRTVAAPPSAPLGLRRRGGPPGGPRRPRAGGAPPGGRGRARQRRAGTARRKVTSMAVTLSRERRSWMASCTMSSTARRGSCSFWGMAARRA